MKNKIMNLVCKKFALVLGFMIVMSNVSLAQSIQEEIDMYQAVFGMEKKAMMAEFLNNEDDVTFWALYDEYEVERKLLGQKRLQLLENYANNYGVMGDEQTDQLMKAIMTQKKSLDKLIDKYYKKIKKSSGSKEAAQFYQIENYILSAIRLEILSNIPFFDEFED
jgi:transcription termination factor NusB